MSNRENITPGSTSFASSLVKVHDKYGRTAYMLQRGVCGPVALMISMPKVYRENHPGQNYLVVDRRLDAELRPRYAEESAEARYYAKRKDAVSRMYELDVPVA